MTTTTPTTQIWACLEKNTALYATAPVWRTLMGDGGGDEFEFFQSAFLQKLPDPAQGIFCERCYSIHEIIHYGPAEHARALAAIGRPPPSLTLDSGPPTQDSGPRTQDLSTMPVRIFAACCNSDTYCPDIELSPADIEQWALNWSKLGRALCQAFGLNSRFTDLKLLNTFQVGTWSADAVPVILTIQSERHQLSTIISQLAVRLRRPYILLAPTNGNLDATGQEFLANANAAFFPLDTNVILTQNGTLHALKAPGELFARFTPQPKECDEDVARRTMALIQQLDSDTRSKPPTVMTVFRLYCMEEFSAEEIAVKCQCSKATVIGRLNLIRQRTGIAPDNLRRFSPNLSKLEDEFTDSRAAHIHRKRLIDDDAAGHESED